MTAIKLVIANRLMLHLNQMRILSPMTESVKESKGVESQRKYNFWYFCNKMQSKIAQHLKEDKNEEILRRISIFPKRSTERKNIIAQMRKNGNFK